MEQTTLILAALDIGTTNMKGESRVYIDGQLVHKVTSPSEALGFSNGTVDAHKFREATSAVLQSVFQDTLIQGHVANGIKPRLVISQLGEAFFAVDAAGDTIGDILHTSQSPLGIGIMETRDLLQIQQITAEHSGVRADEEMTSIMLMDWLQSEPELRDAIVSVLSAGGYLALRLTGQRATTMSVLGREGLANMHTGDISYPILLACDLNPLWFPRVAPFGKPVARIRASEASRLGLPVNLTLYPQIHDQCAAYEAATALTGLDFGVRAIFTGTSNGICAPSHRGLTDEVTEAILHHGYCFYPGLRPEDQMTLLYHFDGAPEESLMRRFGGDQATSDAYAALDQMVFESYVTRQEPIQATYLPCRLMSFPVNRFPEGRTFEDSFRRLPGQAGPLHHVAKLRDSMAGKILAIRAFYDAHCRLLGETPQKRFIAYGGGHTKSIVEFQMYADILRSPIHVIRGETGIKGAMLTTLTTEERESVVPSMQQEAEVVVYDPNSERANEFDQVYVSFLDHLQDAYPHARPAFGS